MVALDEDEKPLPLPPLVPVSDADQRRHREANLRREVRLAKPHALKRLAAES